MRKTLHFVSVAVLMTVCAGARAQENGIDRSGRGAVLCVYMITTQILAIGKRCSPGSHPEVEMALEQAVVDIENFIIANSNRTRAEMEEARQSHFRQMNSRDLFCENVGSAYVALAERGAGPIIASTKDLLAVPREPVANPCL